MQSRLTKMKTSWATRKSRLQEDYDAQCWDFLFFKIWMGILEAEDSFDYKREDVMRRMYDAYVNDRESIPALIEELRYSTRTTRMTSGRQGNSLRNSLPGARSSRSSGRRHCAP